MTQIIFECIISNTAKDAD